jgi:hypothetical protein
MANDRSMLGTVVMDVLLHFNLAAIFYISFSIYSSPVIKRWPTF